MIKKFYIKRLFGNLDVEIPIDDSGIKVLIGENGLGKTTVLNILYYSLIANYSKLAKYDFHEVGIEFSNEQIAILNHDDLSNFISYESIPKRISQRVVEQIPTLALKGITESLRLGKVTNEDIQKHPILLDNIALSSYPCDLVATVLIGFYGDLPKKMHDYKRILDANLEHINIFYFPTYRRIEEDLKNLNIDIEENNDRFDRESVDKLIQFGMDDIQKKFKKIQYDIQKLSSLGLSKISNEILSQLVRGTPEIRIPELDQMDPESIKIILARVGTAMSQQDKDRIVKIISDKKLKDEDKFLVYFIQKLVDIYHDQQGLDNKIKTYIDVCNEYLSFSKKKIIYNESEVEFYIESDFYKDKRLLIDFLSSLSSGEKQILSLFSKIYLSEDNEKFYMLFDEPELSLSIYWQERLLPDIIKSDRCENLIVATHSPFVYDNELEDHAAGLIDYITTVTLKD